MRVRHVLVPTSQKENSSLLDKQKEKHVAEAQSDKDGGVSRAKHLRLYVTRNGKCCVFVGGLVCVRICKHVLVYLCVCV